ncbi:methylglyoxal synthase [Haladaptatus sp. W1]|uniref:methylglyoxal synthase n=1 Tax=Haladaptatus sp. W1 TaxID=1897478 RepID=UPI0008499EDF|nr:methylglyoxal synthase [Haladaptatus sp. W1]ODR80695.1 methylglyoxal synthase [Haladaptatus sp. W1]
MRIALIAHDEKKPDLVEFVRDNIDQLSDVDCISTGTTGQRINENTNLEVEPKASGPLGGDMMIRAAVATGDCQAVIFLRDPLTAQPHEPDINALLRVCDVHDVPLATNLASANAIIDELIKQA